MYVEVGVAPTIMVDMSRHATFVRTALHCTALHCTARSSSSSKAKKSENARNITCPPSVGKAGRAWQSELPLEDGAHRGITRGDLRQVRISSNVPPVTRLIIHACVTGRHPRNLRCHSAVTSTLTGRWAMDPSRHREIFCWSR